MAYARISKWHADKVIAAAIAEQEKRMRVAVEYVRGMVRRKINRGNRSGTNPSLPGEPPKKVRGALFMSIATEVRRDARFGVFGIIGSNLPYSRRLELGFTGIDKLGRRYDQKPRPYLRPSLVESAEAVKRILGAK